MWYIFRIFIWCNWALIAQKECFCRQHDFFLLRFQILCLPLLTWNFHIVTGNFVHIPGISDTWNCFSSKRFIILSGIFGYCFDKQTFPKLLFPLSHWYASPTYLFLHFFFFLFVARAQRLANFVVIAQFYTVYGFKVSISEFKHSKQQFTVCCVKFAAYGLQCSLPSFRRWCKFFVHILSNVCI